MGRMVGGRSLDWNLLDYAPHEGMRRLVRDLNFTYRSKPALHARDCEGEGFEWIVADDQDNSVFAWLRKAPGEKRCRHLQSDTGLS